MSFEPSYELYSKIFSLESVPVESSTLRQYSNYFTILLVLAAFISLSMALLTDKKDSSPVTFFSRAIVASLSIGLGSIYVANSVGVYI